MSTNNRAHGAGASPPNGPAYSSSAASPPNGPAATGSPDGSLNGGVPIATKPTGLSDGATKSDLTVALAKGLPIDEPDSASLQGRGGMFSIFFRRPDESGWHYAKRLCTEGSSVPDALLTVAASQIGQIMLTSPNALWKSGLVSGCLFMLVGMIGSFFTIYLMNSLYCEYKKAKLASGAKQEHITQYHDVIAFHAGKWVGYSAQTFVILQLVGTAIAQIIACGGDWYSIEKSYSKRDLQIIWGAILQICVLFPDFRHFRVMNILALTGTTMTAIWLLYEATAQGYDFQDVRLWPVQVGTVTGPEYFFTGTVVLLNALGGHAIAVEMMDAMSSPKAYSYAYTGGWLWTIFLIVPPSISINLAFPTLIGSNDNVYGLMPNSKAKTASVALMIFHQVAAFCYYLVPVFNIWERFIGTHTKAWYIRLPSRLPVSLFVWLAAMAFPFYSAINSLMAAISVPFTAFAIPCFVYYSIYRKQDARDMSALPPYKFMQANNWRPILWLCMVLGILFVGYGSAAIAYSIKSIAENAQSYGIFAACYQCPSNWQSLLIDPARNVWASG